MVWDDVLERFVENRPMPAMFQALLAHVLPDEVLEEIFGTYAKAQYYKELTFSMTLSVLLRVVLRSKRSCRSAVRDIPNFPVSLTAFYEKIKRVETGLCMGLVRDTVDRIMKIIQQMPNALRADVVPGLRLLTVDGNYLAGTQHRLAETRNDSAAPLPGMSIALRDDRSGLLIRLHCEVDAYTNERDLADHIIDWLSANDLLLGDRNFCMIDLFNGVADRGAFYLIRHHKGLHLHSTCNRVHIGTTESGEVYEDTVRLGASESGPTCRRICVDLFDENEDGDDEVVILTNVMADKASGVLLAELYRRRWKIEHSFQELTDYLRCEVNTLAYPKAALFSFSVAVLAYNLYTAVKAALASSHGLEKVEKELSDYAVAEQIADCQEGMMTSMPETVWAKFLGKTAKEMAVWLTDAAGHADWKRFKKSKSSSKKEKPVKKKGKPHCSTARILAARQNK